MTKDTTIGERFKIFRNEFGMKQPEVAELIGVGKSYISKLERGEKDNPDDAKLVILCSTLALNYEWLKFGNGPMKALSDVSSVPQSAMADPDSIHRSNVKVRTDRMYGSLPEEYEGYHPGTNPGLRAMDRKLMRSMVEELLLDVWEMDPGPKLTHRCHNIMDFFFELGNRRETKRDL